MAVKNSSSPPPKRGAQKPAAIDFDFERPDYRRSYLDHPQTAPETENALPTRLPRLTAPLK